MLPALKLPAFNWPGSQAEVLCAAFPKPIHARRFHARVERTRVPEPVLWPAATGPTVFQFPMPTFASLELPIPRWS